jgi:hypothetical protein
MTRGQAPWYGKRVSRVLLLDADKPVDVFELVELADGIVRVRTAYLFEVGEQLTVRIEREGTSADLQARVRAHTGTGDNRLTELELI